MMMIAAACAGRGGGTPIDSAIDGKPADASGASCADAAVAAQTPCSGPGCPTIALAGDAPSTGPSNFHGFADPTVAHDPDVADRVWLAYSWPHLRQGQDTSGTAVTMAAVTTHLARSDDAGATWSFVGELFPAPAVADPEGSGEMGITSAETVSLAAMSGGGTTTWYAAYLHYFLRPQNGYHPKYATGWTVRIATAATPAQLPAGAQTTLGVSQTAAVYASAARLDQLAGISLAECAMLNNPTLFAQNGQLYLIVECLPFVAGAIDVTTTTVQVYKTTPSGAPSTWTWRYAGKLADHALAQQLGADTIQQPDVSLAADGKVVLVITPAHKDASVQVGTVPDGCAVVELASIDPPMLAKDCADRAVVRARITGRVGACTHDRAAVTGVVTTSEDAAGGGWRLRATGVRP